MSKSWKKILVTGASLLMMASVGACSLNTNNTAHAESALLKSYWKSEPQDARWESVRGAYENQANFGFNKKIGGTITANFKTGSPITVYRHSHSITVVPMLDTPGKVIRVNGHRVYNRHQVLSLLHTYAHHYRRPIRRHYCRHAKKHYRHSIKKTRKHATKKHNRKPLRAIKKVTKRRVRKATKRRTKKVTAYKPTKNKTSNKVANFRKSAKYRSIWTNALKMNQKALHLDLKNAAKYSKRGNIKAAKKANRSANYMRSFVKRDQAMINLGK